MNKEEFIKELEKLDISPTLDQLDKLEKYYELLIFWNEKINLTRIVSKEDVYLKHFYDSLTLVKAVDLSKTPTLCDVGTGAGFPGIPLNIFFPDNNFLLLDSVQKKLSFITFCRKKWKKLGEK